MNGHGHFKVVCKNCDKVIKQCRCMNEKVTGYELCDKCLRILKEEMEKIYEDASLYCAWCKKHSTEWTPPIDTPRNEYGKSGHGMCPECYKDYVAK